jgi:hypothetical protein
MRSRLATAILICTLVSCNSGGIQSGLPNAADNVFTADVSARTCQNRVNDTLPKIEQCITRWSLWHHLTQFQVIADEHPGPLGHGNRNTGTSGYKASVAYVAKLMRQAGYKVTVQAYNYRKEELVGTPVFGADGKVYRYERDWYVARLSGSGTLTANAEPPNGSLDGCASNDFAGFKRGDVALLTVGACDFDTQVANAQTAGARAVVLYNGPGDEGAYEARLTERVDIPVIGVASNSIGSRLMRQYLAGNAPSVRIDVRRHHKSDVDYNLIADSPYGDPNDVVVVEGHLDSIYGAGMLDNASGSTSILEVALNMAKTHTRNRLRYIWFGGEEIGLLGSKYYTAHLTKAQLHQIVFDVDVDVTATPNFDVLVADPKYARKVKEFPPNVVPESQVGNAEFYDFFKSAGITSRPAWFGNNGTDSLSFSLVGVPDTGILTNQDCCKHGWEVALWGGFLGNYEGKIPSHNGGCVDQPHRWCDNLSNNDPFVFEFVSKSVAYVTFKLANRHFKW